jgi:hypothetical protein
MGGVRRHAHTSLPMASSGACSALVGWCHRQFAQRRREGRRLLLLGLPSARLQVLHQGLRAVEERDLTAPRVERGQPYHCLDG